MAISFKGAHFPPEGVPVVLEQKTTILWKSLYLLASLKDPSGFGVTYETKRSSEEENPVHGRNTTVNVDKIRGFRPPYVWMKTFGYCWPTPKCQNLCVPHAFFEGKKAEETSPKKSTPRTLKEVGQQYPPVKSTSWRHLIQSQPRC